MMANKPQQPRHPRARSPPQTLRSRALAQDEGSRYDPSGGRSSSAGWTSLVWGPRHRPEGSQAQALRAREL